MNSTLLLITANIRKRKLQNLLFGSIMFLSSLLVCTALMVLNGVQSPFEKMYEQLRTSHFLFHFDDEIYNAQQLSDWWSRQKGVENTEIYNSIELDGFFYKDEKNEILTVLSERPFHKMTQDLLFHQQGDDFLIRQGSPAPDQCWLPRFIADSSGIKLGDFISLALPSGMKELEVSSIVIDPQYNSVFGDGVRIWVSPGSLAVMAPLSMLSRSSLSVYCSPYADRIELRRAFNDYLGGAFTGVESDFQMNRYANTMVYQMAGTGILAVGIIALIIALFLVYTNISNFILSDYKTIGVLKALGFVPRQFPIAYGFLFLLVALPFILIGLISSAFCSGELVSAIARNMGIGSVETRVYGFALLTFLILMITLGSVSLFLASGAAKVKASEAIRTGESRGNTKGRRLLKLENRKGRCLSAFIGFRNLISSRKRIVNTIICFSLTILTTAISLNVIHALEDQSWWGFPDADLTINRGTGLTGSMTHRRFKELLEGYQEISSIVEYQDPINVSIFNPDTLDYDLIYGTALSENMQEASLSHLEGRNPSGPDEISIGSGLSRKYHKAVGDQLEIFVYGIKKTYRISGIYQFANHMGINLRMPMEAFEAIHPLFEPSVYLVNLVPETDPELFRNRLEDRFGMSAQVILKTKYDKMVQRNITSIHNGMITLFSMIILVFLIISFIVVSNDIVMQCMESRRGFGILKAIGMTPNQLRLSFVFRSLMIMSVCLFISLPLAAVLSPILMKIAFRFAGLTSFHVSIHSAGYLLLIPFFIAIAALSAWVPSVQAVRIRAQELITD